MQRELDFVAQPLVDNGYSNRDIQDVTRKTLDHWHNQQERPSDSRQKIKLYYRNFMHSEYKNDETVLRNLINNNVSAVDPDSVVDLIIFYRNEKTSQFFIKNSPPPTPHTHPANSDPLKRHGVAYCTLCPVDGCNHSHIGMTTTKLSKRLAVHLQEGNFFQRYMRNYEALRRPLLLQSTSILDKDQDCRCLRRRDALPFMRLKPTLNVTQETFFLPTNVRKNMPNNHEVIAAEGAIVCEPEGPSAAEIRENPAAPDSPIQLRRSARLRSPRCR